MRKIKLGWLMVGMGAGMACLAAAGILALGGRGGGPVNAPALLANGGGPVDASALLANGGAPAWALLGLIILALATLAVGIVCIAQGCRERKYHDKR